MKNYVAALVLLATLPVYAFDMDKCLKQEGDSTMGMKSCVSQEYQELDKDLNEAYKKALATMTKEDSYYKDSPTQTELPSQRLIKAEQAWIAFRDAECSAKAESIGGTLEGLEIQTCLNEMTKARTESLNKLAARDDSK